MEDNHLTFGESYLNIPNGLILISKNVLEEKYGFIGGKSYY